MSTTSLTSPAVAAAAAPLSSIIKNNKLTRDILIDSYELLSHQILTDRSNPIKSCEQYSSLKTFGDLLDIKTCEYGKEYCFLRISRIIMVACIFDPYGKERNKKEQKLLLEENVNGWPRMYKWDRKRWGQLEASLLTTKKLLVRQDATYNIQKELLLKNENEDDDDNNNIIENNEINHTVNNSKWFHKKLNKILQIIHINKALSKLRYPIEKQIYETYINPTKKEEEEEEEDDDDEGAQQQQEDKKKQPPNVEQQDVDEFAKYIQDNFIDDDMSLQVLEKLLVRSRSKSGGSTIHLKSLDVIAKDFQKVPFSLIHLQTKINDLLVQWRKIVYGDEHIPILVKLGYRDNDCLIGITNEQGEVIIQDQQGQEEEDDDDDLVVNNNNEEEDTASFHTAEDDRKQAATGNDDDDEGDDNNKNQAVDDLKTARTNLQNEVVDPLEESKEIAAVAAAASSVARGSSSRKKHPPSSSAKKKKRLYRSPNNKKVGTRITFEDSDDDEIEDSDDDSVDDGNNVNKLSDVPDRAKIKTPSSKRSREQVPSDHVDFCPNGHKRRKRFTDEEKTAIRAGVRKFGIGKWSEIKSEYPVALRNRTNVQIKDAYRTMCKNNEG